MMSNTPFSLRPYSTPSRMPSDTAGKQGLVHLGFELDSRGYSILRKWERRAPLIVQQELYFDRGWPELPCVYILSSGGPNVEGDRYRHQIELKEGAYAHISTGAATKLASMQRNYSSLRQNITLAAGSYLEYLPEPTIPCRDTRYHSEVDITINPTATLFHSEIILCGRKHYGELFDYDLLHLSTRVENPQHSELYADTMLIEPKKRGISHRGIMGDYDIFATALILTSPTMAEPIYSDAYELLHNNTSIFGGITHLPNDCGLIVRILSNNSGDVKHTMRQLCAIVRGRVAKRPMYDDFVWR